MSPSRRGGVLGAVALMLLLLLTCGGVVVGRHPPPGVDIRLVILRTAEYVAAIITALALFNGLAAVTSLWLDGTPTLNTLGILAVAVALTFVPIRNLLATALDRLLFGDRLDTLGAARRFGDKLSSARLVAASSLPELSAATEVAAYRIIAEALTNVARHASSDCADVEITASNNALVIVVADAGAAAPNGWQPGVGLSPMRERAEQLGGTFSAEPGEDGGVVRVSLPLL